MCACLEGKNVWNLLVPFEFQPLFQASYKQELNHLWYAWILEVGVQLKPLEVLHSEDKIISLQMRYNFD